MALQTYSVREICQVYHTKIQEFKGQRLPHEDAKNQGWTLILQTYSVLEVCTGYHRQIQTFKGGHWRYKLTVSLQFTKSTVKKQKNKGGGRWRYKLTVSSKFAKSTM